MPIKVRCECAQDGPDDHDSRCHKKNDASTNSDRQWHANQVANAPRLCELRAMEGYTHDLHGQSRVCHERGNISVVFTDSHITWDVEAQKTAKPGDK
jgi:hypothetical protein